MENNTQHIDDLLVKHLTGEATEADRREVQQWLAWDEQNRRYFDHFRLIWEESENLAANTEVDEEAAWERFQHRARQQAATPPARVFPMNNPLMRAAAIAAIFIGIAVLTFYLFHNNPGHVIELATIQAADSVKTNALPDGSEVVLNKQSQLSYPKEFTGDKRPIQLNGEAFFKVQPNKAKPFVVKTNNVTITVLGTSFNVRSRGDSTEVIVETGVVQVTNDENTITLTAGEKAIVYQNSLQKLASTDKLYNYYRSKKFVCENTPLWKLVEKVNEAYDTNIVIETPALRDRRIDVTFDEESLDGILTVMRETLEFSVVKEKGQIILR